MSEYMKEWRRKKIALGECLRCDGKAIPGKLYCERCKALQSAHLKMRLLKLKYGIAVKTPHEAVMVYAAMKLHKKRMKLIAMYGVKEMLKRMRGKHVERGLEHFSDDLKMIE